MSPRSARTLAFAVLAVVVSMVGTVPVVARIIWGPVGGRR